MAKASIIFVFICCLGYVTLEDIFSSVVDTILDPEAALTQVEDTVVTQVEDAVVSGTEDVVKEAESYLAKLTTLGNYTTYTLYTRAINETPVKIDFHNWHEVKKHVVPHKEFKFITHGWMSAGCDFELQGLKNAYLKDRDINVILVDWSKVADTINYPLPVVLTKHIGEQYGKLVAHLVHNGIKLQSVHLLGHSLGAHVSGYAAKEIDKLVGKVDRVTGLDPALPGFIVDPGLERTDGRFVDVIHTCGGLAGKLDSMGDVDFYPNGGTPPQPGCTDIATCSHERSHEFFAASINKKNVFKSRRCKSWDDFLQEHCERDETIMGDHVSRHAKGNFYLKTKGEPPFAMEQKSDLDEIFASL